MAAGAVALILVALLLGGCASEEEVSHPHPISIAEAESRFANIIANWLYESYTDDPGLSVQAKKSALNEAMMFIEASPDFPGMINDWAIVRESELAGRIPPDEAEGYREMILDYFYDNYTQDIYEMFERRRGT